MDRSLEVDGDQVMREEIIVSGGEDINLPVFLGDDRNSVTFGVEGDTRFAGEVDVRSLDVDLIRVHEVEQCFGGLAEFDDLVAVEDGGHFLALRCVPADVDSLTQFPDKTKTPG